MANVKAWTNGAVGEPSYPEAFEIVKKAVLPLSARSFLLALSTESLAVSQQSTSVCVTPSKLAASKGRWRALATTTRVRSSMPSDTARFPALRIA